MSSTSHPGACLACARPLVEGESFCRHCGAAVRAHEPEAPAPDPSSCTGCGAPMRATERFCRACGRPADATPVTVVGPRVAPVTTIDPIDVSPAPPPPARRERRRGRRTAVVTATIAVLALAAAAAAFAVLHLTGDEPDEPVAVARDDATSTPPAPMPIARRVAFRIRRDVVPLQNDLNLELRALTYDLTPMRGATRAATKLERRLLQLQGWGTGLRPRTAKDRAVLQALRKTLSSHALYASFIGGISPVAKELPPWVANKAVTRADAARDAYFRLNGVAPVIPVVALPVDVHERLRSMITREEPEQPQTPPTEPEVTPPVDDPVDTSADEDAIRNVITSHWQAVNAGDYYGAYALFSPAFKRRATAAGWVKAKNTDRPQSSPVTIGRVVVSGSTATAYVSFSTRGSDTSAGNTGCNRWNGSYTLAKVSSAWYIDASQLVRTGLDCSTYSG